MAKRSNDRERIGESYFVMLWFQSHLEIILYLEIAWRLLNVTLSMDFVNALNTSWWWVCWKTQDFAFHESEDFGSVSGESIITWCESIFFYFKQSSNPESDHIMWINSFGVWKKNIYNTFGEREECPYRVHVVWRVTTGHFMTSAIFRVAGGCQAFKMRIALGSRSKVFPNICRESSSIYVSWGTQPLEGILCLGMWMARGCWPCSWSAIGRFLSAFLVGFDTLSIPSDSVRLSKVTACLPCPWTSRFSPALSLAYRHVQFPIHPFAPSQGVLLRRVSPDSFWRRAVFSVHQVALAQAQGQR